MRAPAYRRRDMDQADAAFFLIAATVAQAATEIINGTNMQSNCHIVLCSATDSLYKSRNFNSRPRSCIQPSSSVKKFAQLSTKAALEKDIPE